MEKNPIHKLTTVAIIVFVVMSMIVVWFFFYKLSIEGLVNRKVCFEAVCIERFFIGIKDVFDVIEYMIKIIVAAVTISGVYLALESYLSSLHSSKINIHLLHMNSFKDYIRHEIEFDGLVKLKSVNLFKIYNLIFSNSRDGSINVSESYKNAIYELNNIIKGSNEQVMKGPCFDYKEHQSKVIKQLKIIGVNISRLPRNDFYEVEGAVYSLIDKINTEFCSLDVKYTIRSRSYN